MDIEMTELNNQINQTKIEDAQENASSVTVVDFKMVTFDLAGKDYGIDIMNVKEIAKAGRFTYVPNTLPFVLGVYNLRGEIIPILDLRLFFNIPVPERNENKMENLLILDVADQKFGVVVDKVDKVVGVQKSTIQPPHPLFGDISIKYISGVVESNNRLYILLDVSRIFASKEEKEAEVQHKAEYKPAMSLGAGAAAQVAKSAAPVVNNAKPVISSVAAAQPKIDNGDAELEKQVKFISDNLANYNKFFASEVNKSWLRHRVSGWKKSQLQNENEVEEFLAPFWSAFSGKWWTKNYADDLAGLLPENSAKQIVVWNAGCGKGHETYSLACVLKKKYPNAKIRIYAQDTDLLGVSNAALMSVPPELAKDWYGPYLTRKTNGEYTFNQEIKDSIMFEYHDCKNTNNLPMVDIVFARDVLSLMDQKSQDSVIADFQEKMKGNAIAIIGENESMPSAFRFGEKNNGALIAYTKE